MRTVAILAGGASQRMGTDKASLVVDGETLLVRTVRIAREAGFATIVAGRPRPNDWPGADPTRFLPDETPGAGPLGGLATALRDVGGPVLALACDLPRLDSRALLWLVEQWRETDGEGLAAARGGQPEPLLAIYTPSLLPRIDARLASGRRALKGLLAEAAIPLVEVPEEWASILDGANTPEEWERFVSPPVFP